MRHVTFDPNIIIISKVVFFKKNFIFLHFGVKFSNFRPIYVVRRNQTERMPSERSNCYAY